MADPVVHITNGLPDSGTGNITTLGQTLLDGANVTLGAKADAKNSATDTTAISVVSVLKQISASVQAAAASVAGTLTVATHAVTQSGSWVLSAGSAILGKMSLVDSAGTDATDTTNHAIRVNIVAGAGSGGTALNDGATFTEGTGAGTSFTPIGGLFKSSQTPLTTGEAGVIALTANREASASITSQSAFTVAAGAADAKTMRVTVDTGQLAALATTAGAMSAGYQLIAPATDSLVPNKVQATANGSTSSRVVASASSNTATNLKASAGNITEIDVFNTSAASVFLKFYNKASSPTVGTDTPVWTIPIAAGTGYSKSFKNGKSFATGISYGITLLQADSNTGALAAGDLTGSIDWI